MKQWVKMPSYWIRDPERLPLATLKWVGPTKADQIAALMLYIVLVHHATDEPDADSPTKGVCRLTYDKLAGITGLSRAKISGGLKLLVNLGLVSVSGANTRPVYKIEDYSSPRGWAKLPAKGLYTPSYDRVAPFHHFHLRSRNELNALKIYLVIVAFRHNDTNHAQIGYDRISELTGVHKGDIRLALSLLINLGLIQLTKTQSKINEFSTSNMYRLCHLDGYRHHVTPLGT